MKKVILILFTIIAFSANAQLYTASEMNITYGIWTDSNNFDNLKLHGGEDVLWSINMGQGTVIMPATTTILVDNKFLSIGVYQGMEPSVNLATINGWDNTPFFQQWQYLEKKSDFSGVIDYKKVFYRPSSKTLYLPFVQKDGGSVYSILVELPSDESGITETSYNAPVESAQYYNLQGLPVDENAKGQVIIKKEGTKSTKYINR